MSSGLYIKRFIDKLQTLQAQNAKEFNMSIHEARQLHGDITKTLLDNNNIYPRNETTTTPEVDKVLEVEIKAPPF
jgi:hypothetical protein